MSYIDHHESRVVAVPTADGKSAYRTEAVLTHSWTEHTKARMDFIYPGRDHDAAQAADVARWNNLGRGKVAA